MLTAGVLISGTGTNLQAILDRVADGTLACRVAVVISNRAGAGGLERARGAGVATRVIDHRAFAGREAFDAALAGVLDAGWRAQKEREVRDLLLACAGVFAEATAADFRVAPGGEIEVTASAMNRSPAAVTLDAVELPWSDAGAGVVALGRTLPIAKGGGAAEAIEKVLEAAPDNVGALLTLARLHERSERWDDAAAALERAAQSAGAPAEVAEIQFRTAEALRRKLILLSAGTWGQVVRIIPPLVTTEGEVDQAVSIIGESLQAAGAS